MLRGIISAAAAPFALLLAGPGTTGTVEEFHAYLLPDTSRVLPDSLVEIRFEVDSTAHQFNAYEVTIQFDPTVVSFESVIEGPLMTDACLNRFERVTETDSTVTYAHSLLCAGVSLDGPGVLSIFRFRADSLGTSPITIISDPDRTFYDAGLYVWENHPTYPRQVVFHDAAIVVEEPTTEVPERVPASGLRLSAARPNPMRQAGEIEYVLDHAGSASVRIHDVGGRLVRTLLDGWQTAGAHRIVWDGSDDEGRTAPSGVYFYRLEAGGESAQRRLTRIR